MSLTVKELDAQIAELLAKRETLVKEERNSFTRDAQHWVGHCFMWHGRPVLLTAVSGDAPTFGCVNAARYHALWLYPEASDVSEYDPGAEFPPAMKQGTLALDLSFQDKDVVEIDVGEYLRAFDCACARLRSNILDTLYQRVNEGLLDG